MAGEEWCLAESEVGGYDEMLFEKSDVVEMQDGKQRGFESVFRLNLLNSIVGKVVGCILSQQQE